MDNPHNDNFRLLMAKAKRDPRLVGVVSSSPDLLEQSQLEQVGSLIRSGSLDYRQIDQQGRTLWGHLTNHLEDTDQLLAIIEVMMRQGGNPLWARDDEMEQLAKNKVIRRGLDDLLARFEVEGVVFRDDRGGTFYHALTRIEITRLADPLEQLRKKQETPSEGTEYFQTKTGWITESDKQGNTPLHLIWSQDTYDRVVKNKGPVPDKNSRQTEMLENRLNAWCLSLTVDLIALGGDVLSENHDGQTVWELIEARNIEQLEDRNMYGWDPLKAETEQRLLDRATPQVGSQGKPGLRL